MGPKLHVWNKHGHGQPAVRGPEDVCAELQNQAKALCRAKRQWAMRQRQDARLSHGLFTQFT